MVFFDRLKLYPYTVDSVGFKNTNNFRYTIIYFPENSSLMDEYSNLNIDRRFSKRINVVGSKLLRIIVNGTTLKKYKDLGLLPVISPTEKQENFFVDTSLFMDKLEERFKPDSYRKQNIQTRVISHLEEIKNRHPDRETVLLYTVNLTKEFNASIFKRRFWPLFNNYLETGKFLFDNVLLCLVTGSGSKYYLLSNKDMTVAPARLRGFLLSLSPTIEPLEDKEDEVSRTTTEIYNGIKEEIEDENRENFKSMIYRYLKSSPSLIKKIIDKGVDRRTSLSITNQSIIYSVSGSKIKAAKATKNKTQDELQFMLQKVKDNLLQTVVTRDPVKNNNRDALFKDIPVNKINEQNEPSHILKKRINDFRDTFERDLRNSFKLLGDKDPYLKLKSMKKSKITPPANDLEPSEYDLYTIELIDSKRKVHTIELTIPRLLDDGTFMLNGRKQYIVYQMILDPIFFLKADHAKVETLYAALSVRWKKTKLKSYFQLYLGGVRLPMMLILGYWLGFEEALKLFGIKYKFVEAGEGSDPDGPNYQFDDGSYIVFDYNTAHARELINSLHEINYSFGRESIFDKNEFHEAIIKSTRNRNVIFVISEVLSNIMEPVAVEILKSKFLPHQLPGVILYICEEMVKGRVDSRNNIAHQRIRTSEVFIQQIQSLMLGSYNDYKFRRVSGDSGVEFRMDATQTIKEIVNSSHVRDLENINPTEELSCLTRVTPTGVGGIPDERAIPKSARNIHPTYHGNLDSMDTPEGSNIGIINQLAVGAQITSSRGSFVDKTDIADDKAGILGVNSALIPYVGSTDGARVMFSGAQGRQAIPINGKEQPLSQTGYESIMTGLLTNSYIKRAVDDGKVMEVTENIIKIKLKSGKVQKQDLNSKVLRSGQGLSSINYFSSTVKPGSVVKKNDIIAEGKHIKDGVISVGTNLLCGVMAYKGYTFEDGYVVSESIAKQKFTSSSYYEVKIFLKTDDDVKLINTEGNYTKKGEPLLIRTSKNIEDFIGMDEMSELDQGSLIHKSPGGKIIALELYPNISIKKFPKMIPAYENFKKKYEESKGEFPKKFSFRIGSDKGEHSGILVIFRIEQEMELELGDKLSNSFGGKGVVALVEKDEYMPRLPSGEHLDILLNPIAIINRMNLSSCLELHTSMIAKHLAKHLVSFGTKKTKKAIDFVYRVLSTLDNTKDQQYSKSVRISFSKMSERQYSDYIQRLKDNNYVFPIFVPPFQEASQDQIRKALKLVGAKESYKLWLEEFKTYTKYPIAVGYLYYKKLEQQSAIKMSARSTGVVDMKTRQATRGKKVGGGQKIGELDSWSIINHGATNVLREFFGPLSDDHVTKNQIISEIIQHGSAEYKEPKTSPTRELFEVYMKGLMLDTK